MVVVNGRREIKRKSEESKRNWEMWGKRQQWWGRKSA